jgi:crossover junction endodeoxyribonuclease RuvC
MVKDPEVKELSWPRSPKFPCFIGIDPGKKGGIAAVRSDGELLAYRPMGEARDLAAFLMGRNIVRCYVERCQAMPSQGVKSMFTYGVGYGKILSVLEVLNGGISFDTVPPQTWQKKVIPGTKKGETKKAALVKARQLFPQEQFVLEGCRTAHDGIVDAVLIAEYGRGLHV